MPHVRPTANAFILTATAFPPVATALRLMVIAFSLLVLTGCPSSGNSGKEGKDGKGKGKEVGPPVVGVVHPHREIRGQVREYTGSLESDNQVAVVPQLAGQLTSVTVTVGDSVRRGQILATVDDSQLEAQVAQARSSAEAARAGVQTALANQAAARDQSLAAEQAVGQAQAQVIQAEAAVSKTETQLRLAQRELDRQRGLAAKDLVAIQVVDQAAATAEAAEADVRSSKAQLKATQTQLQQSKLRAATAASQERASVSQVTSAQAQAASQASALEAAEVRRGYSRITSPLDGVVIARPLDPGAYVAPASSNPVLVVASLRSLRVSFQLSEADLSLVQPMQKLQVRFESLPNLILDGQVQRLAGGLDPSTRTVRVEVRLLKSNKLLRPGMLARLKLEGPARKALVVPLQAVVSEGKRHFVWRVQADNKVTKAEVEVESLEGDVALIKSGVSMEDSLIVRGVDLVQEGKMVQPAEVPRDSRESKPVESPSPSPRPAASLAPVTPSPTGTP